MKANDEDTSVWSKWMRLISSAGKGRAVMILGVNMSDHFLLLPTWHVLE